MGFLGRAGHLTAQQADYRMAMEGSVWTHWNQMGLHQT